MRTSSPSIARRGLRTTVAGLLAGAFALTSLISPAAANPAAAARTAASTVSTAPVVDVQSRDEWRRWRSDREPRFSRDYDRRDWRDRDDRRRYWRDRDDRRRYWRDRDRDNDDLAAGLGGLAAGAIIGGLIGSSGAVSAGPRSAVPPAGGYAPGSRGYIAYCSEKYRSFRPETGTFTGYDGNTYYCR